MPGARALRGCSIRVTVGPRISACAFVWRKMPLPVCFPIGNDWDFRLKPWCRLTQPRSATRRIDPWLWRSLSASWSTTACGGPISELSGIHFARATPYETVFERKVEPGEQVLAPEVARAVKKAMAGVVESGTARRLNGVFKLSDGKLLTVGGKTGSGDNRIKTFDRWGGVTSSRATNRTAAFVFYIGDRYFGVVTAYVQGREAEKYHFTSSLPVTILKLLAPTILAKLDKNGAQRPAPPVENRVDAAPRKIDFKPLDSVSNATAR